MLLWLEGATAPFHLHGILPLVVAVLLPRVLVLYMIYLDQGISLWFIIHLVVGAAGVGRIGRVLLAAADGSGMISARCSITDRPGGTSLG